MRECRAELGLQEHAQLQQKKKPRLHYACDADVTAKHPSSAEKEFAQDPKERLF